MRLTPGALLLTFRQKFGHGMRVAYYRDVVRSQILRTPAIPKTDDSTCEIHVLTSTRDWMDLLWGLKSFYFVSKRHYALAIHDDGSLGHAEVAMLEKHFPNARIITRSQSNAVMEKALSRFPRSLCFRQGNPLALKVFDFSAFLESDRMLLLDSDILFFSEPWELLRRIEDPRYARNTLNKDWQFGYTLKPASIQPMLDYEFQSHINSGLGLIHKSSIDLQAIEDLLAVPGVIGHHHRIEQTLIALYSCRFGFEFLPREYDVRVDTGIPRLPCVHYTGPIRHLLYREGIRELIRMGLLDRFKSN